jgi:cytoskeletal protein RodZ
VSKAVHRKLLYSVVVLVLSAVLAASAFAQETTDQESETADINREVVVDEPSSDSSTDSAEDPSTPPASDSIFASMPDDICPAVLDPFIVESFRDAAPALLERCETLPSEATISDQIPVTEYQGEVPTL